MTGYIVDTNILFAAILKPAGSIGKFLKSQTEYSISLKAPSFLKRELTKHQEKLVKLTGRSAKDVDSAISELYDHVSFVEDKEIPILYYARAFRMIGEIDSDDLSFVALSLYEDEFLLTGDKKLVKGLLEKGYTKVLTFQQLKEKHDIP